MRKERRIVYYCDFCKKRSLRSLAKHEKNCTANPGRSCGICGGGAFSEVKEKYAALFSLKDKEIHIPGFKDPDIIKVAEYKEPFTWENIRDDLDGCPACLLAVLRQLGLLYHYHETVNNNYNLRKTFDDYWAEENNRRSEDQGGYCEH